MASILTLSAELLQKIFEDVFEQDAKIEQRVCRWRLSLLRVCRQWARLWEPYAYRSLLFHHGEPRLTPKMMIGRLKRRPYLGEYIQHVRVDRIPTGYDRDAYRRFFDLVVPISHLHLTGPFSALVSLLAHMAEADCLSSLHTEISLDAILHTFRDSHLEEVHITNSNWAECLFRPPPASSQSTTGPVPQQTLEHYFPEIRPRTGRLRHLRLSCPNLKPSNVFHFLRWPRKLETFELINPTVEFVHHDLQIMLDMHASSLRSITLTNTRSTRQESTDLREQWLQLKDTFRLNLSTYPHLTHLTLSAHDNLLLQNPMRLAEKLASPTLQSLTITFTPYSEVGPDYQIFNDHSVTFLGSLVTTILTLQPCTSSSSQLLPFKILHLDYQPRPQTWSHRDPGFISDILDDTTYPWDYLEQAKALLVGVGVQMTWHQMDITREKWMQEVGAAIRRFEFTGNVAINPLRML